MEYSAEAGMQGKYGSCVQYMVPWQILAMKDVQAVVDCDRTVSRLAHIPPANSIYHLTQKATMNPANLPHLFPAHSAAQM